MTDSTATPQWRHIDNPGDEPRIDRVLVTGLRSLTRTAEFAIKSSKILGDIEQEKFHEGRLSAFKDILEIASIPIGNDQ